MQTYLRWLLAIAALLATPAFAQPPAARPPAAQTTDVLVVLTVKPEAPHDLVLKTMPDEVRATVRLYLDAKIRQWYARSDGHGVVFILACKDVDEARAVMEGLPLSQHKFVNLEFTALTPLTPLRYLLNEPAARQ
jgi:hypothetical protein